MNEGQVRHLALDCFNNRHSECRGHNAGMACQCPCHLVVRQEEAAEVPAKRWKEDGDDKLRWLIRRQLTHYGPLEGYAPNTFTSQWITEARDALSAPSVGEQEAEVPVDWLSDTEAERLAKLYLEASDEQNDLRKQIATALAAARALSTATQKDEHYRDIFEQQKNLITRQEDINNELRQRIAELTAQVNSLNDKAIDAAKEIVARAQIADSGCGSCGGPHDFDTSIPSVIWNQVIRAKGLSEYLCSNCIVREFVRAGQGFTATLWNEEFNGVPIEVIVNGQNARDASAIQDENNSLRNRIAELTHPPSISEQPRCPDCNAYMQPGEGRCSTRAPISEQAQRRLARRIFDEFVSTRTTNADGPIGQRLIDNVAAIIEAEFGKGEDVTPPVLGVEE